MKKILIIGSTCADIIINLEDHLPASGEDVHVRTQSMSLGGCAYNVSDSVRHTGAPYILFTPMGTGIYGDFVRQKLAERGITTPVPTPDEDNGCCYCFVEDTGERSFVSYHGAEYRFEKEWFSLLDVNEIDTVYICGLEIEESTGPNIVSFLEENPQLRIFFAPGPRLTRISQKLLSRLYRLSPILHLNETEALEAAGIMSDSDPGISEAGQAAEALYTRTNNTVIVTLGDKGCFYYDGKSSAVIPAKKTAQIDTIGAGDAHIGTLMGCLQLGDSLPEAIRKANLIASAVVGFTGALLPDDTAAEILP